MNWTDVRPMDEGAIRGSSDEFGNVTIEFEGRWYSIGKTACIAGVMFYVDVSHDMPECVAEDIIRGKFREAVKYCPKDVEPMTQEAMRILHNLRSEDK